MLTPAGRLELAQQQRTRPRPPPPPANAETAPHALVSDHSDVINGAAEISPPRSRLPAEATKGKNDACAKKTFFAPRLQRETSEITQRQAP